MALTLAVAGPEPSMPCTPAADPAGLGFSPGGSLVGSDGLADEVEEIVAVGARWIRIDVAWPRIEPEPGRFDWGATDEAVAAARAAGLEVLGLLAYTPAWARPGGTDDKTPPTDPEAFAAFAAAAARRYGPLGVRAWEIWNEPNSAEFWAPAPDPAGYARLAVPAAAAIRAADPGALVVSGGLAPAVDAADGSELRPARFLGAVAALGVLEAVDAVGIHPYSFPAMPEDPAPWNTFASLDEIDALLAELTAAPPPLWATELGFPTGPTPPAVSQAAQADGLEQAVLAWQRRERAGPLFLYAVTDDRTRDEGFAFGVVDEDGRRKPAWAALHALLACG